MKLKKVEEPTESQREIVQLKKTIADLQEQLIRANASALSSQSMLLHETARKNDARAYLTSIVCEWNNGQRYSLNVPYTPIIE